MRFLVDNQLPRQLVRYLKDRGHDAVHVAGIGLEEADDAIVWRCAIDDRWVVISKDEDFFFLANRPGDAGSLLWLRIGNCRKAALFAVLDRSLEAIVEAPPVNASSNLGEVAASGVATVNTRRSSGSARWCW